MANDVERTCMATDGHMYSTGTVADKDWYSVEADIGRDGEAADREKFKAESGRDWSLASDLSP